MRVILKENEMLYPCRCCGAVLAVDQNQDIFEELEYIIYPDREYGRTNVFSHTKHKVFKCPECQGLTELYKASEVIFRNGIDDIKMKVTLK